MFNIDEDAVLLGCRKKRLVVLESFDGWFGDEHVNLALDSIERNGIVSGIRSEDSDGGTRGQGINCGFVGIGVSGIIGGVRFEGGVEIIVDIGDVFREMLAWVM